MAVKESRIEVSEKLGDMITTLFQATRCALRFIPESNFTNKGYLYLELFGDKATKNGIDYTLDNIVQAFSVLVLMHTALFECADLAEDLKHSLKTGKPCYSEVKPHERNKDNCGRA